MFLVIRNQNSAENNNKKKLLSSGRTTFEIRDKELIKHKNASVLDSYKLVSQETMTIILKQVEEIN